MNVRDQIISFLLQQTDAKDRAIEEYQKQIADLRKQLEQKPIVVEEKVN